MTRENTRYDEARHVGGHRGELCKQATLPGSIGIATANFLFLLPAALSAP